MSGGTPIHTWRDLLLPDGQDTRVFLPHVDDKGAEYPARTSTFALQEWIPNRLPTSAHLVKDLPSGMQSHLRDVLAQHYANQVVGTGFMDDVGFSVTPHGALTQLRAKAHRIDFWLNYKSGVIAESLSDLVANIHYALTGNWLQFQDQVHAKHKAVITDHVYQLDDRVKILWENKSPKVFDAFIERLVEQMRIHQSTLNLCASIQGTKYQGYEAILGKVCGFVCPY